MASVLVLNQYFPPDPVSTAGHVAAIASRLAVEGHSVAALVSQPSYQQELDVAPEHEVVGGVEVTRIGLGPRTGRERMASRVEGYLRFLGGARFRAKRTSADVVLSFHNPPPLGLLASGIAKRAGAAHIHVIQDIHPDIVLATGFVNLPAPAVRAWDAANRRVLKSADATVVLGEGMKATLVEGKGADPAKVEVIPLWAEPELEPRAPDLAWRAENGVGDDALLILCAGNMGIMHPLERVLDAAAALEGRNVLILLVGGGARREHWEGEVARRGLGDRVRFLDFQFGEDFARVVAASDLAIVPLGEGMERLALPARTFALLSAGCPVIALMSPGADVSRIVTEARAGWQAGDGAELAALLERLGDDRDAIDEAGSAARAVFELSFTREAVTGEYARLVDQVLAGRPHRGSR